LSAVFDGSLRLNQPETAMSNPQAFTIKQFCSAFSVGRTAVYREISLGRLPVRKLGRRTLILIEDAEKWAQSLPAPERK